MKKLIVAVLLTATGLACAQTEMVIEDANGAVSYDTPVVYQSQVTYNAPVIYNAPVFYLSARSPEMMGYATSSCVHPSYCESSYSECAPRRSPNVIIVGRGAYYTSWDTTPNVLIIGRTPQARVSSARSFRP